MQNYIKIGKLIATKGLNGHLLLKHFLQTKVGPDKLKCIFIEDKSKSFIPYFPQEVKARSPDEILVRFDGVTTVDEARKFLRKDAWLTEENFAELPSSESPISLLGFTIISDGSVLGEIVEVIEQPQQLLCKVMIENNEVLIPIHDESLIHLDKHKRILDVALPDGLLDIYLDK